jgi:hypothetical protein
MFYICGNVRTEYQRDDLKTETIRNASLEAKGELCGLCGVKGWRCR